MKMIDTELYEAMRFHVRDLREVAEQADPDDAFENGYATGLYESARILEERFNLCEGTDASGEPMPYKVLRDGDKVRFD